MDGRSNTLLVPHFDSTFGGEPGYKGASLPGERQILCSVSPQFSSDFGVLPCFNRMGQFEFRSECAVTQCTRSTTCLGCWENLNRSASDQFRWFSRAYPRNLTIPVHQKGERDPLYCIPSLPGLDDQELGVTEGVLVGVIIPYQKFSSTPRRTPLNITDFAFLHGFVS
jgi:hypothetical protein